jgi:large subunit ribosomal protein L9e
MPRPVIHQEHYKFPEDIKATAKAGVITIKGRRGELTKDLSHLKLDFEIDEKENELVARCWFGNRKLLARVGTLMGLVKNMVIGVTNGYLFKMRYVYSHFPIQGKCEDDKSAFSFTHFMGQKEKKQVVAPKGVTIEMSKDQKDEIIIQGNDLEAVSLVCGQIHQLTRIKNKDLRKFLDGIYVSERKYIQE